MEAREEDERFFAEWFGMMMQTAQRQGVSAREAVGSGSALCFERNGMREKLGGISDLDGFAAVLRRDFGWTVEQEKTGVLLCHENNEACLCPIVRLREGNVSGAICFCTEKELERMAECATGRKAKATVLHSYVRDGQSCVYRIEVSGAETADDRE